MRFSGLWTVVVIVSALTPPPLLATTVSPPPPHEYVTQVWVGFSVDDASALRLDLKPDGGGSGAELSGDEIRQFRVLSWAQKDDTLEVTIEFADEHRAQARLTGKFKTYLLSYNSKMLPHPEKVYEGKLPGPLELTYEAGGIRYGLWPEKDLQRRLLKLQSQTPAQSHE